MLPGLVVCGIPVSLRSELRNNNDNATRRYPRMPVSSRVVWAKAKDCNSRQSRIVEEEIS